MNKKTIFAKSSRSNASKLHLGVLTLLKAAYPGFTVLEEQQIDANVMGRPTKLPIDLVLRELRVAIEVQGQR